MHVHLGIMFTTIGIRGQNYKMGKPKSLNPALPIRNTVGDGSRETKAKQVCQVIGTLVLATPPYPFILNLWRQGEGPLETSREL